MLCGIPNTPLGYNNIACRNAISSFNRIQKQNERQVFVAIY